MPRRNLKGTWGESTPISVRLSPEERGDIRHLCEQWGCTTSAAIRRAIRDAARRTRPAKTSRRSDSESP